MCVGRSRSSWKCGTREGKDTRTAARSAIKIREREPRREIKWKNVARHSISLPPPPLHPLWTFRISPRVRRSRTSIATGGGKKRAGLETDLNIFPESSRDAQVLSARNKRPRAHEKGDQCAQQRRFRFLLAPPILSRIASLSFRYHAALLTQVQLM